MRAGREHLREGLRYTATVAVGLVTDLTVAWLTNRVLSWPLVFCGAIGFATGVAVNYVLFEKWVFRTGRISLPRLGKAYAGALGALAVRLGSIAVFAEVLPVPGTSPLAILAMATGLSFLVNFVLVRRLLRS